MSRSPRSNPWPTPWLGPGVARPGPSSLPGFGSGWDRARDPWRASPTALSHLTFVTMGCGLAGLLDSIEWLPQWGWNSVADEIDATDVAARQAIGQELRRARDAIGWTRAELVTRLPFRVHVQTIAGYERGTVQCSTNRFLVLCGTLGISAPDALAWAMQRAEIDLPTIGAQIDLRAVVHDKAPDLLPLRRWARRRLKDNPSTGVARLAWPVIQELATVLGMGRDEFVRTLILFTPRPVPQRR